MAPSFFYGGNMGSGSLLPQGLLLGFLGGLSFFFGGFVIVFLFFLSFF